MKKNLLAIIILALLIVNIVLTGFMMFSVVGASQKTSALVGDIAAVLKLELGDGTGAAGDGTAATVSLKDSVTYNMPDPMTMPLKIGEDGKQHYTTLMVSLSMDSKHKDYKDYGGDGDLSATVSMIQDAMITVYSNYTYEQITGDAETIINQIKAECLERIKGIYNSDFIYNISLRDIKYQ